MERAIAIAPNYARARSEYAWLRLLGWIFRFDPSPAPPAVILDQFNEYGVQIMSPHYRGDPQQLKVVPKSGWFPAPATRPEPETQPGKQPAT